MDFDEWLRKRPMIEPGPRQPGTLVRAYDHAEVNIVLGVRADFSLGGWAATLRCDGSLVYYTQTGIREV